MNGNPMASELSPARTPRRRRHFGYVATISPLAVATQYRGVLPVFRDSLREYLGISVGQFGLLFSLGPLLGVFAVLFGGTLVDRLGAARVIRYSLRGAALSFFLAAFAGRSFWAFMASACLGSLAAGPLNAAMQVYVSRLFPRDRRRALSLLLALLSGGGIAIPLIAEALLNWGKAVGFGPVLHVPFLAAGLALAAGSFLYRPSKAERARRPAGNVRAAWRQFLLPLPLAWLVALGALHGVADSTLHVWMPKFLSGESFPEHPVPPGVVLSAYSLAYLVARGMLALLPAGFGKRALLAAPGLAGGGLLIAGILSRNFWLTAGGYVLGAFVWSNGYPAILSAIAEHSGRQFGTAIACKGVLGAVCGAASIATVGWLTEALGDPNMWVAMLLPASGFVALGLGAFAWVAWFGRKAPLERKTAQKG